MHRIPIQKVDRAQDRTWKPEATWSQHYPLQHCAAKKEDIEQENKNETIVICKHSTKIKKKIKKNSVEYTHQQRK